MVWVQQSFLSAAEKLRQIPVNIETFTAFNGTAGLDWAKRANVLPKPGTKKKAGEKKGKKAGKKKGG